MYRSKTKHCASRSAPLLVTSYEVSPSFPCRVCFLLIFRLKFCGIPRSDISGDGHLSVNISLSSGHIHFQQCHKHV